MQDANRQGIYYGWYIVLAAFVGNFMGVGTSFYIFNAFIEPLCKLRGWTRTELNIAPMLGYIVNLFCILAYGTLVSRVGPRILMTLGSLISAVSFLMLGVSSSLWMFYLFFMLLFTGIAGMSGIVTATAVNNWFVLKRGNALGLATTGVSLSGVILPILALAVMERSGLFDAFVWISIAMCLVAPLSWLTVKTRPEDCGLLPDGARHEGSVVYDEEVFRNGGDASGAAGRPAHWTLPMVVRSQAFWKIGFSYGLSMISVVGVMFQLKPRFSDVGFDGKTAMNLMAATALVGTAGKYVWALLCDKFSPRKVSTLLIFFNAAGLGLLLIPGSIAAVVLFILIYGFAMGGVVSTQPVIIADYFGREAYPTVARYIGVIVGINCISYPIMGRSFDITGSYDTAYLIFIVLNLVAVLLMASLKKPSLTSPPGPLSH
ncbi:MAG: hypothetical protein A2W19_07605 [Spirochaetes bacterium RBG_16_49_21]|nr:MAG: hypothetical protein A2W19_07605 [Spirochaetes bacterium RBG_16_49_21]